MTHQDLGELISTRAVDDLRETSSDFDLFVRTCLDQYMENNWGVLSEEDKVQNDRAVKEGDERLLASYPFPEGATWNAVSGWGMKENKLWIITERDHSVTTILFPGEY